MKDATHNRSTSKAFRYFALCYAILFVFSMLVMAAVYVNIHGEMVADAKRITYLELEKSGLKLDHLFELSREFSLQLSKQQAFKNIISRAKVYDGSEEYRLLLAKQAFADVSSITDVFRGGYLYIKSSDRVISINGVYKSAKEYYDFNIQGISFDQWKNTVTGKRIAVFNDGEMICFFNEVMLENSSRTSSISCFYINQIDLEQIMKSVFDTDFFGVMNKSGTMLLSNLPDNATDDLSDSIRKNTENIFTDVIDGKEMLVAVYNSQTDNISYIKAVPLCEAYKDLNQIETMLVLITASMVIVGILVIVLLSWSNTKLIRGFVKIISPATSVKDISDEFSTIRESIINLQNENVHYQNLLTKLKTSLKTGFFFRMFSGEFANEGELYSSMNDSGLCIEGKIFCAGFLFCSDGDISMNLLVTASEDRNVYINPTGSGRYSLLFTRRDGGEEDFLYEATKLYSALSSDTVVCLGCLCDNLMQIPVSYDEALQCFREGRKECGGVFVYGKVSGNCEDDTELEKPTNNLDVKEVGINEGRQLDNNQHATQLELRIRKYLMVNYLDPMLSLTTIAQAMDLSEQYLSIFFKQKTGINISTYVEQMRIEYAYHLLTDTDLSIAEVAKESGYQTYNTFRRAFKRLMGCTPGQVRQDNDT